MRIVLTSLSLFVLGQLLSLQCDLTGTVDTALHTVDLCRGGHVVVGEHLEAHLQLLFRPPDLVVELGMMQSQPAVNRKCLEGDLICRSEGCPVPQSRS